MRTLLQLSDLATIGKPFVLAAGAFDGVHRGHQAVVARARQEALRLQGETWVLTFDPHPLKVLRPVLAPALLTSTPHKLRLLASQGLDGCLVIPFTREFAREEPEEFIAQLRGVAPQLAAMVVGANWTFGYRARGNLDLLRDLASRRGIAVVGADPVLCQGEPISSTRIRRAVSRGHLAEAEEMLGRPFTMLGTVIPGQQVGRQLGFPTANLDPHNEVRPPAGIYAARVLYGGEALPAAAYLGGRRTHPANAIVEVHILDRQLELYGRDLEVLFVKKLRDDHAFPSRDELRQAIAKDVAHARQVLQDGGQPQLSLESKPPPDYG